MALHFGWHELFGRVEIQYDFYLNYSLNSFLNVGKLFPSLHIFLNDDIDLPSFLTLLS